MNYIGSDLVYDIIKFMKHADLRELSKASPIFDVKINELGLKMFYVVDEKNISVGNGIRNNNDGVIDFSVKDVLIIKTKSGKKDILQITDSGFVSLLTGYSAIKTSINWVANVNMKLSWRIDHSNGLGMAYDWGSSHAIHTGREIGIVLADLQFYLRAKNIGEQSISISREMNCPIIYVDLVTTNVIGALQNSTGIYLSTEQFDVIYYGREWIKLGSWHKYKPDYIQN